MQSFYNIMFERCLITVVHYGPPILFAYEPTRRFTKRVPGLQSLPYDERCNLLGIDRVVLRGLRADLILCYKIIRGWFCCLVTGFALIYNSITTHGYSFKLFYRILDLILDRIFSLFVCWRIGLITRRSCFGWSVVLVRSSSETYKFKPVFGRKSLDI